MFPSVPHCWGWLRPLWSTLLRNVAWRFFLIQRDNAAFLCPAMVETRSSNFTLKNDPNAVPRPVRDRTADAAIASSRRSRVAFERPSTRSFPSRVPLFPFIFEFCFGAWKVRRWLVLFSTLFQESQSTLSTGRGRPRSSFSVLITLYFCFWPRRHSSTSSCWPLSFVTPFLLHWRLPLTVAPNQSIMIHIRCSSRER